MVLSLVANLAGDGLRDLGGAPMTALITAGSWRWCWCSCCYGTVFILQHNSPTDPVHAFLGANATPAAVAPPTPPVSATTGRSWCSTPATWPG